MIPCDTIDQMSFIRGISCLSLVHFGANQKSLLLRGISYLSLVHMALFNVIEHSHIMNPRRFMVSYDD